jgi:hypothetical protein
LKSAHEVMQVDHVLYPEQGSSSGAPQKKRSRMSKAPSAKKLASLPHVDTFSKLELAAARKMVQTEANSGPAPPSDEDFAIMWDKAHYNSNGSGMPAAVYLPSQQKFGQWSSASRPDKIGTMRLHYSQICELMAKAVKQAEKLTESANLRLSGYRRRAELMVKGTQISLKDLESKCIEYECFRHLQHLEQTSQHDRENTIVSRLKQEVCAHVCFVMPELLMAVTTVLVKGRDGRNVSAWCSSAACA